MLSRGNISKNRQIAKCHSQACVSAGELRVRFDRLLKIRDRFAQFIPILLIREELSLLIEAPRLGVLCAASLTRVAESGIPELICAKDSFLPDDDDGKRYRRRHASDQNYFLA